MESTALLLTLTMISLAIGLALVLVRRSVMGRQAEQEFRVRGELEPVVELNDRRRPDVVLRRVA